jgi:hypothetical protein
MKKRILTIVLLTAVGLPAGCAGPARDSTLWDKIHQLQAEKNQLQTRTENLEAENQQLLEQCHALDALDPAVRLSALDRLVRIQIGKRSRLTDPNKDGQIDTLIIHLEPVDQAEDIVKAPGEVRVSLWRLEPAADKHLLAEWAVSAEQLKTTWGHSLTGRYYRLTFALPEGMPNKPEDLTVKVEFTDYLTGRILTAQTPITAR